MRSVLVKYRGPMAAGFALFAATLVWAWVQRNEALKDQRHNQIRHSESLAKGMTILVDCVDAERPENEAVLRRAVREQLVLRPPIRFAVFKRGERTIVTHGHVPTALGTQLRPGLSSSEDLLIVRHRLSGRPGPPESGDGSAPPPPMSGPPPPPGPPPHADSGKPPPRRGHPWEWSTSPPPGDEDRPQPLMLYVGVDAGFSPHGREREIRRMAMILGLSWLAIAALVFAWVRSIRSRILAAELEAEQRERVRLDELNLAAAGLAHETKNPLGLILGLTHRLADSTDTSSEIRETLEQIMDEADRATARLSDFINFARIADPNWSQADLANLVGHVTAALQPDFDAAGVQLALDVNEITVECDAAMLEQVVVNLLLNSLQASEADSTTTVRVTRQGSEATLLVSDQGRGIATELQPEIFKPYVSGRAGGHGLGLAIVRQIVQQHGWSIEVSSEPGEGTEISVSGLRIASKKERRK